MELTLGFSPCPNDTFIFDAMVNGLIDSKGIRFRVLMEDVETLNLWAEEGRLDITKLSYHAFLNTIDKYALLHHGSALGKGVGPLLVARPETAGLWQQIEWQQQARIAIPGRNTTANLLLSLAFPAMKNKEEMLFSDIEKAVSAGTFDAGLIIHESRFTYEKKGLVKLADLGDWWEITAGAAIPLGGIAIRRNIDRSVAAAVDGMIRESLDYAWGRYPELSPFITGNAQEMEEEVMRRHINLYVNEYTRELGSEGYNAILTLFRQARNAGMVEREDIERLVFY